MTYQPDPEHFRQAAAVVTARGLTRGTYEDKDGAVCTIGAVALAYTGDPEGLVEDGAESPVLEAIAAAIDPDYIPGWKSVRTAFDIVSDWSDETARNAEEVAALLNRVAARVTTEEMAE